MYYGYVRVSTETQAEKGYGLDTQKAAIAKYTAANGIEIAGMFADEGISGAAKATATDDEAISKRRGLLEMLAKVAEGDTVIVMNTSRLWRANIVKVIIQRELMQRRVKIISIEQPNYDLYAKDPTEQFSRGLFELLDEYERAQIAMKLARGRMTKAKQGNKPAGAIPFGYAYSGDKKSVVVVESEAAIVKRIYSRVQSGCSLQSIADELNADGLQTRQGKAWTKGSIHVIVRNRFYVGDLQHGGEVYKGNQPPIISRVQFGKVAKQLDRRHK